MRLRLFADYHQIYVCDEGAGLTAAPVWSDQDGRDGISGVPGFLAIATARATMVEVDIDLHAAPPPLQDGDHIVEDDLSVTDARIVVAGCTDYYPDAQRLAIAPGNWRVRITTTGLSTISADGLDGDDLYRIDLWPAAALGRSVRKRATSKSRAL